jgi:(S)-mandelate dehydrogenase
LIADVVRHPAWLAATLKAGIPEFANIKPYVPAGANRQTRATAMARQHSASVDEAFLGRIRDSWSGHLVVKGILSPTTAKAAQNAGADGLIVSNHGGRQLASAPATIEALPAVRAAVGPDMTVMLDSGIREGSDIVKTLCLGADFVFSGRTFIYGTGAAGAAGATQAYEILIDELDRTLAQIGCSKLKDISPSYLWQPLHAPR